MSKEEKYKEGNIKVGALAQEEEKEYLFDLKIESRTENQQKLKLLTLLWKGAGLNGQKYNQLMSFEMEVGDKGEVNREIVEL